MSRRTKYLVLHSVLAFAFFSVLLPTAKADSSSLNQYLKDHYKKKVRLLRHFYTADQLKYNASGELVGQAQPGPWTLAGIVRIDGIYVSRQGIEIQGRRLDLAASKSKYLDYGQSDRGVAILIEVDPQSLTSENVEMIFSKIFLTEQDHFEDLVPQFWKACIAVATAGGNPKEMVECKVFRKISCVAGCARHSC
jgi:hypothetical protein